MNSVVANGHGGPSSNPGQGSFLSKYANTLEKGMNSTILFPAMGK